MGSRWGHVDISINNAGDALPDKPQYQRFGQSDLRAWCRMLEASFKGVYLIVHALLPLLSSGTEKTIVNVTSVGSLVLTAGAIADQLSKLAVMHLFESLNLSFEEAPGRHEMRMTISPRRGRVPGTP